MNFRGKSFPVGDIDLTPFFPAAIQALDNVHWCPGDLIPIVSEFLLPSPGMSLLDIGSGPGKFCLTASYIKPDASFYGVEQRKDLVECADKVKGLLGREHVHFIHANFTRIDLKQFTSFFYYNSFFENFPEAGKIDHSIEFSVPLYHYYTGYLKNELDTLPAGTRIATYCSWNDEIPATYMLQEMHCSGRLKFFIKL